MMVGSLGMHGSRIGSANAPDRSSGRLKAASPRAPGPGCGSVDAASAAARRREEERPMAERAMPSFTKSPPELVARFGEILERYPDATRKPMFGYPAAFVGGNMATGLFADRWVVRLPDGEIAEAKSAGAEPFEPMPGK